MKRRSCQAKLSSNSRLDGEGEPIRLISHWTSPGMLKVDCHLRLLVKVAGCADKMKQLTMMK